MGRHKVNVRSVGDEGPQWQHRYRCEWGVVVGHRVKRLRIARELKLWELAELVARPGGGHYSTGFMSRLERGWASPPLWVYTLLAERFELAPGRLLGTEGFEAPVSQAELTMVRVVRRLGLETDEAITRIVAGGS